MARRLRRRAPQPPGAPSPGCALAGLRAQGVAGRALAGLRGQGRTGPGRTVARYKGQKDVGTNGPARISEGVPAGRSQTCRLPNNGRRPGMLYVQGGDGGRIRLDLPDVAVTLGAVPRKAIKECSVIEPFNLVVNTPWLRQNRFLAAGQVQDRRPSNVRPAPCRCSSCNATRVPSGDTDGHSTPSWTAVSVLADRLPLTSQIRPDDAAVA